MTLGAFISFSVGLVMMYQPLKRVTRINLALQQALASARRLFEVLDEPVLVVDRPGATPLGPFENGIRFEGVSFAYPGGPDVLSNVDLAVPRGSVTALVGPSGAGKTTLANLLPRFMDVTGGRIAIDGVDVRDVTLASLRGAMALVTQEVVLFDDTVRRNVAYGLPDVPEETDSRGPRRRERGGVRRRPPEGARHARRGGRRPALGRPEAAARHRAGSPEGPADPHPRRGDVGPRHRERAGGAGRPRAPHGRSDDARHRPPPLDGAARRPDRRSRTRPARRARPSRRAPGARRRLPEAARPGGLRRGEDHVKSMTGFGRAQAALPDGTADLDHRPRRQPPLPRPVAEDAGRPRGSRGAAAQARLLGRRAGARRPLGPGLEAGGRRRLDRRRHGGALRPGVAAARGGERAPGRAVGARPALPAGRRPHRRGRGGRVARGRDPRRDRAPRSTISTRPAAARGRRRRRPSG